MACRNAICHAAYSEAEPRLDCRLMIEKIYTSCTPDCPDGCGVIAHVEGGRMIKLEGDPHHEFTNGYL